MSYPPGKPHTDKQIIRDALRRADAKRGVKIKKPRKQMEGDFQVQLVNVLRLALLPPARVWFVPNGGNLSKAQRGRFKAMGLTAGVHDLHVIWRRPFDEAQAPALDAEGNGIAPCFGTLELKAGKGELTEGQEDFAKSMEACGHQWAEVRTITEALKTLAQWGVPMRRVQGLLDDEG